MNDQICVLTRSSGTSANYEKSYHMTGLINGKKFTAEVKDNIQTLDGGHYEIKMADETEYSGSFQGQQIESLHEVSEDANGTRETFSWLRCSYGTTDIVRTFQMPAHDKIKRTIGESVNVLFKEQLEFQMRPFEIPEGMSLEQYERTTGLSSITEGKAPNEKCGYMLEKRATRTRMRGLLSETQCIKYIYSSREAFLDGELPEVIHMRKFNRMKDESRFFRKKGDTYIDHQSFKRKRTGEYVYSTLTYEEIMQLPGDVIKMLKPKLTDKTESVVKGEYKVPQIICDVIEDRLREWGVKKGNELDNVL